MKKLLAVVLAAATVLSLGVSSFALDSTKDTDHSGKEIVIGLDAGSPAIGGSDFPVNWILDDTGSNFAANEIVKPDQTLYFAIGADAATNEFLADGDVAKVKFDKGDENAKMIASMSLEEKNLTNSPFSGRYSYAKIVLKEDMTDKEYKLNPSITFTAKKWIVFNSSLEIIGAADDEAAAKAIEDGVYVEPGTKLTFNLKFWMGNSTEDADRDYAAGTGGVMLKPQKNEDNEIIWNDEIRDLARLTFVGDSNVVKVFPKLSTKWDNQDYAEYFADQDAFLFDFVGNMKEATKISSTSRATLEIYNPYYDSEEDELTVDPEDVVIYQVDVDGTFTDVTASFKAGENDDGDSVFTTKTRELGTYIFAEKVAGATVEEEVDAPETDKEIPNTGR